MFFLIIATILAVDENKVPFSSWKAISPAQERFNKIRNNFLLSDVDAGKHEEIAFDSGFVLPIEGKQILLGAIGKGIDGKKFVVMDLNRNGLLSDEKGYEIMGDLPITVEVKFHDLSFRPLNLHVNQGRYSYQCGYYFPVGIKLFGESKALAVLPSGLVFLDEDQDGVYEKYCPSTSPLSFGGHHFLVKVLMDEKQLLLNPTDLKPVVPGYPAPDLKGMIFDTKEIFDLKNTRFETVILGFCPPDCAGSRISFPGLKRLTNVLDRYDSVAFFAVLPKPEEATRIKTHFDFSPQFLFGRDYYSDWQIKTTPVFFIVNKDGSIRERIEGGSESIDDRLCSYLKENKRSNGHLAK